ncbi:MAG: Trk system potassium transporter TrkA [Rhodospirillales bacterium]|nr:Trk system potassium transporter TrkA [Rhodospirillales bacterium]MCB9965021.1 Trk system potassium transporter TrkA [Rhodospirillales bacterium]
MRMIICGAGQVGYNIATHLARENNDITVIDLKSELIAKINDEQDVKGIVGHASDPDVLHAAGADDADMIIAVTHSDEVNMVACQIAHSLFNIPKKIARIRFQGYLDPAWANLFSRSHMPIDVIISPEREVAYNIFERLKTPGTTDTISLLNEQAYCLSILCTQSCPILNTPFKQLLKLFPDLAARIILINRSGKLIIPDVQSQLLAGDEVMFIVKREHVQRALNTFGYEGKEAKSILLIGGGNIGTQLCHILKEEYGTVDLRVIENSAARARDFSQTFPRSLVIQGDGLDKKILEEAGVQTVETVISVTNDDEVNILSALLASEYGSARCITLVNKEVYGSLTSVLNINAIVSPRMITAATIMKHVRRGRINATHPIKDGFAEIIEVRASEACQIINTPIQDLHLPNGVFIALIQRDHEIFIPDKRSTVKPNDVLVIFAIHASVSLVEKLFSFKFDFL